MVEIHKAAQEVPREEWNSIPPLSYGMSPYRYVTRKDAEGYYIEVILRGIFNYEDLGAAVIMTEPREYANRAIYVRDWILPNDVDPAYGAVLLDRYERDLIEVFNDVVEALERGDNIKEIADRLGLSPVMHYFV